MRAYFSEFRLRELGELVRRAADRLGRRLEQRVAHRLVGERLVAFGVEPRDDGGGRALGRERREPGFERDALVADLLQGLDIRHRRRARLAGLREDLDRAGNVMRQRRRRPKERDLHVAGDEIVDRLARSSIWHMLQLHVGHLGEPLQQHMLVRADAGRRATQGPCLLHSRDQFGNCVHPKRRMNHEHLRLAAEQAHRHHVLQVLDAELLHMRRADEVIVRDKEIVAVRRGLDPGVDADGAARTAGAVLDEHLLAEVAREMVADEARDEIEPAAGRQMHDEAHRLVRPVLRECDVRGEQRGAEGCRAFENRAPLDGHAFLQCVFSVCLVARMERSAIRGRCGFL